MYIKAEDNRITLYMENFKNFRTYFYLNWYEKRLLIPEFFRCHKSYFVNCRFIEYIWNGEIVLKNNIRIPLSRNRKQSLIENCKNLKEKIYKLEHQNNQG